MLRYGNSITGSSLIGKCNLRLGVISAGEEAVRWDSTGQKSGRSSCQSLASQGKTPREACICIGDSLHCLHPQRCKTDAHTGTLTQCFSACRLLTKFNQKFLKTVMMWLSLELEEAQTHQTPQKLWVTAQETTKCAFCETIHNPPPFHAFTPASQRQSLSWVWRWWFSHQTPLFGMQPHVVLGIGLPLWAPGFPCLLMFRPTRQRFAMKWNRVCLFMRCKMTEMKANVFAHLLSWLQQD